MKRSRYPEDQIIGILKEQEAGTPGQDRGRGQVGAIVRDESPAFLSQCFQPLAQPIVIARRRW
jgi:hypothetical protein